MRLTAGDRRFIESIVQSDSYRSILIQRLEEDQLLVSTAASRRKVIRSLAALFLLFMEIITIPFRRPGKTSNHPTFYDSNAQSNPSRLAYLLYHRPDAVFTGINYQSRILPGLKAVSSFPLLARTFVSLLKAIFQPSELSGHYTRILRTCLLIASHTNGSGKQELYLFRLYQPESIISAAYLSERNVLIHLVPSTTPLAPYNRRLIGDSLIICNPYQSDEFSCYKDLGSCHKSESWSPEEIVPMNEYYSSRTSPVLPNIMGLYTQGYWLRERRKLLNPELIPELVRREQELHQFLVSYINGITNLELIIFPHPMERRHYQQTGEYPFSTGASERIRVDFSGVNSNFTFNLVGLGLTTVSTIGFDRLFMGFRTLFYVPPTGFLDLSVPSPYRPLFCLTKDQLLEQIERWRTRSHAEFMQSIFGRVFWQPEQERT